MFSLKAANRECAALRCSLLPTSNGMVSDLVMRFLVPCALSAAAWKVLLTCLLVDAGGVGSLVFGIKPESCLEYETDGALGTTFFARAGRGRLLKVRLRGIPPMGSSGKQT